MVKQKENKIVLSHEKIMQMYYRRDSIKLQKNNEVLKREKAKRLGLYRKCGK